MFPFDDAHFEARRGGLEVKEPKDLLCQSNNSILRMCIKSTCPAMSLSILPEGVAQEMSEGRAGRGHSKHQPPPANQELHP